MTYSVVFDSEPDKKYPYLPPIDGRATATYPNKDVFVGEFKDGKRTGPGVYTFASGAKYDGEYFENKKQGSGTFVAPDGGKYEGQWYNDKRHGKGTYTYPSGDTYVGEWKNGAKYGKGMYTYFGINTSISGTWSNGQCVDGVWNIHDGSSYNGSFLGNQPAGDGLFTFPSGNKAAGRFANGKFSVENFKRPHPNAKPPAMVQPDPVRIAERIVDKAVSKLDHNTNMHVLKTEVPGVANYRRLGNGPAFSSGQPSIDAFRRLNEVLTEAGFDRIVQCNLRDDLVVYVNQLPFSPRDPNALNTPIVLDPSISAEAIKELELRMAENIKFAIKRKGGLHDYFEEMYADEAAPQKLTGNEQKSLPCNDPTEVRAVTQVFEFLAEEDCAFEYQRVPIPDDKAPTPAQFDQLTAVMRSLEGGCALFSDAMGLGRTTLASVIAGLLVKENVAEEEEGGDDEEEEGEKKPAKEVKQPPAYDPSEPDFAKGQWRVIMRLIQAINGPTRQELEALREQEREEFYAAKEAQENAEREAKAALEAQKVAEAAAAAEEGEGDAAEEGEGDAAKEEAPAEEGEAKEEAADEEAPEEAEEAKQEALPDEFVSKLPKEPSTAGSFLKMELDEAIDKAAACLNLRTVVADYKKICENPALSPEEKQMYTEKARNSLERYFYLIMYSLYVKEQEKLGEEAFSTSFSKWVEGKQDLFAILGTREEGELAEFNFA